jgi:hypothetical protein
MSVAVASICHTRIAESISLVVTYHRQSIYSTNSYQPHSFLWRVEGASPQWPLVRIFECSCLVQQSRIYHIHRGCCFLTTSEWWVGRDHRDRLLHRLILTDSIPERVTDLLWSMLVLRTLSDEILGALSPLTIISPKAISLNLLWSVS